MKEVTIVSSLFNIKREGMDGRTWEEYLQWFDITLKLKCPMVLFVTEDLVSFIEERRKNIPTEIIVQSVNDIPYQYLADKIEVVINSDDYKNKILDPERIECQHSLYSIVQYSKFKWLKQAIEENPFNSKFFFWVDAGGSRFFENYDLNQEYPSSNAIEALEGMGEKFLIQMNMEYYKDLANAETLDENYLLDNRSYILGSMFGGTQNSLLKVANDVEEVLLEKMLNQGFVNNEQIALGYLVKQNPDDYEVYERYDGKHMSLFLELGKR
jgi:Bacterial protein of unknown function (HtrL_YibB)